MTTIVLQRQEQGYTRTLRASPTSDTTQLSTVAAEVRALDSGSMAPAATLKGLGRPVLPPSDGPSKSFHDSFAAGNAWMPSGRRLPLPKTDTAAAAKTGSSALLDDSVCETPIATVPSVQFPPSATHSLWQSPRFTPAQTVQPRPSDSQQPIGANSSASSSTHVGRPQHINLGSLNNHSRMSFANSSNGVTTTADSTATQASRADRPSSSAFAADSTAQFEGSIRGLGTAQPSPVEDRFSHISPSLNGHRSIAPSRDNSLPPSRHGDDTRSDAFSSFGRYAPDSFRRPSNATSIMSHANATGGLNMPGNPFGQSTFSEMRSQFNGFANQHEHAISDTYSTGLPSRRGSVQINQPSALANSFVPQSHYGGRNPFPDSDYNPPSRPRTEPVYTNDTRAPSTNGSSHESRRDSGQFREYNIWNNQYTNSAQPQYLDSRLHPYAYYQQAAQQPNMADYQVAQIMQQFSRMHPYGLPYGMPTQAPYYTSQYNNPLPIGSHLREEQFSGHSSGANRILEELKSTRPSARKLELKDIMEHIVELAGDKDGSRFIQSKIATANSEEKARVFKAILPNARQLMACVYGNYVIQVLFVNGDSSQKRTLANQLKGHMHNLSTQPYGCRAVQKAIECIYVSQQIELIRELEANVLHYVKDQHGNHVLQCVLIHCPPENTRFIVDVFFGQVQTLATHVYGCRLIQRIIEHAEPDKKKAIMEELKPGLGSLIGDQYGNYVVQCIVQFGSDVERGWVIDVVTDGIEMWSKHKFASNVVEKCLAYGTNAFRRLVYQTILDGAERSSESLLLSMIKDQYGNYVIQTLLDKLEMQDYYRLRNSVAPELHKARKSGCGKQVAALEKRMDRKDEPVVTFASVANGALAGSNKTSPPATTEAAATPA